MTRRQSKNQWNGGIAAHSAPKNSECKNPLGKFSPQFFFGSRWHTLTWLSSNWPNYQSGVLLISAGAIEGHFEGKTRRECQKAGPCSCTTMLRLTVHLQPRRNWPTWSSNVLITYTILRIWPRRTCSLDLVGRKTFWIFFLSRLRKLEQWAKKCLELRGNMLNKSRVWSL